MLRERRRAANFKPNRRLDRKSSRGMIYENEELRLRTININAEVERGQSDIRKLRRENEQLRREIWSLRDEYDRLDQILRHDKQTQGGEQQSSSSRHHRQKHREEGAGCCGLEEEECEEEEDEDEECCSCNKSGGEDHCEECDSGDNYCDDENCNCCGAEGGGDSCDTNREAGAKTPTPAGETTPGTLAASPLGQALPSSLSSSSTGPTNARLLNGTSTGSSSAKSREHLHVNFDHLSIVSEENLTGSDGSNSVHNLPADAVDHHNCLTVPPALGPAKDGKDPTAASASHPPASSSTSSYYSSYNNTSRAHLMSLPATPCSPLLTDFQSLVPPLQHFENINYDDIKPLPSSSSPSSSTREPPTGLLSPSVRSKFIAHASSSRKHSVAVPSAAAVAASTADINRAAASPAADVPAVAPSPEPPDSSPSPSPSPPSLLPIVASSISSSDWIANNKTVSFSTFRSPTASASQWSLSAAATAPDTHPLRPCDSSPRLGWQEGEMVPISPKPKHFFAPLKSARSPMLPSSPDLYVHDVLASPNGSADSLNVVHETVTTAAVLEPIYTTIHKSRPSYPLSITCSPIGGAIENPLYASQLSPSSSTGGSYTNPIAGGGGGVNNNVTRCPPRSPTAFQVGGNLDELLQDIESMADEVAHIDMNGASGDEVDGGSHRLVPVSSRELGACCSDLTPPPNLPEPMNLLPATLPYLDFKSNTAVITTPKAAMANRSALLGNGGAAAAPTTIVTSVASKPISSASAVRKKLFGKKNKEPVINEPEYDAKAPVVPLKLTIPPETIADDKANDPQQHQPSQSKVASPVVASNNATKDGDVEATPGNSKQKARRVSLSFPGFGGGGGGSGKKSLPEDEKDTSSLENCPASTSNGLNLQSQGKKATAIHRVSSGADISSISTSIGSPSTPVKGPCSHHRHNSQRKGKGKPGHSRTSSESQNVYSSPGHGHHHCDMGRRNSTMNDAMTTSMSERNSNSLASSRESSSSLSMRSQKSRRISENSHSNGKIPWCGCWGNGCL